MQVVDRMATSSVTTDEATRLSRSPELRRALRQARALAAAGRWRKLIMTLTEAGPDGDHPELVVERLRAAVELNDEGEIAACADAAQRLARIEDRIKLASQLINSNRPAEAGRIMASLPAGDRSTKAIKVAQRILAATRDSATQASLRQFIGRDRGQSPGQQPIVHRYPGDTDAFDLPSSTLDIVRLEGVATAIEDRVRDIWTAFADRLETRPFPLVREYENVFTNETGQIWSADGDPIKSYGLAVPGGIDATSVPVLDEAFSCVREHKGYYEWLVDRLATLSWRLAPDAPDCPILLRKEQRGLALDALTPLGIAENKIVSIPGPVFCRRLYVGSSSSAALARTAAYQHSYGRLMDLAALRDRGDTPRRFYISRRDSPRRSMANELAFEAAIATRGFTPIVLSELGLLEKINLFRNAEAVIGAHGAGLSHLLFAKPGLRVVEIMPVTMSQFSHMGARVCFSLLSKVFGLQHTMVLHPMNPATSEWASDPALIESLI